MAAAPTPGGGPGGGRAGRPAPGGRRGGGPRAPPRGAAGRTHADGAHAHDVRAFALVLDEPLDWDAFAVWLTLLLHSRGLDVLRVKGLLDVGAAGPGVLDGGQHGVHPPRHPHAWPHDERPTPVVFITPGTP